MDFLNAASYVGEAALHTWHFLMEASVYVLFGLLVSGLLRVFLMPQTVARHLGKGRFMSVFKAALIGIPIPLCSCGVLPAAMSLKKQGATSGATTAFMISTPESGVDSIAITYALLDPIMTVARPVAAFITAFVAGILENLFHKEKEDEEMPADLKCLIDGCCDGVDCPPEIHAGHHSLAEKLRAGLNFAITDVWGDIAGWFWVGLILAGIAVVVIPDDLIGRHLGPGLPSMLIMLAVGMPMYICATASTPIAAALILKGLSPGAALVFLLAGPATNVTSLTVLLGVLGKRAAMIYLGVIAVMSVLCGLALDGIYGWLGISARAAAGQAAELIPGWAETAGAVIIVLISIRPLSMSVRRFMARRRLFGKGHAENVSSNVTLMDRMPGGSGSKASCDGKDCRCSH